MDTISIDRNDFTEEIYYDILSLASAYAPYEYHEYEKNVKLLLEQNNLLNQEEKDYYKERLKNDIEACYEKDKIGERKMCKYSEETHYRYSDKYCEICIQQNFQKYLIKSENEIIDKFIQACLLESAIPPYIMQCIPIEQFEDIYFFAKGGFSKVYRATWNIGKIESWDDSKQEFIYHGKCNVVLKCLKNSENLGKTFLEEARNHIKIRSNTIVECFGITKLKDNSYALVLNYFHSGNLRDRLQNNFSMRIKDKLLYIQSLCESLYDIHRRDLIHKDLHSGNVLVDKTQCYITDFGFTGPVEDKFSFKLYGILPYLSPELLYGEKHTKASDVYSLGMLIWEIFNQITPFHYRAYDINLAHDICMGARPEITFNIPKNFQNLIQDCLNNDPHKRPNAKEIYNYVNREVIQFFANPNSYDQSSNEKVQKNMNKHILIRELHPLTLCTSQIIDFINSLRFSNLICEEKILTLNANQDSELEYYSDDYDIMKD
ncbi:2145_t:CDS:1 [Racocetra fulgida]|uniref:2145_t:CDS:1 n=1 Tax=Racocetra fulgida TaxID=60492 RepID=A0A9N9BQ96_9GLOM|nr:2145_t:CDS:1 [Racocetra fulgida]